MTKRQADNDGEEASFFIASPKWQGAKPGYYFGTTSERGTGYYLDSLGPTPAEQQQDARTSGAKKKKRVRIDTSANELLDQAEQQAVGRKVVTLTQTGIKAAIAALSRAMERNITARAKGGGSATYMESEIALYENIVPLKAIAADATKLYPTILESTLSDDMMQLLLHENIDVAESVTSVLLEWLDSDLAEESPVVIDLAKHLLSRNVAELLVDNLSRTPDGENHDDEVGRGTEDILSVIENLLEMEQQDSTLGTATLLCKDTKLIPWLLESGSPRSIEMLSYIAAKEEVHEVIPNWGAVKRATKNGKTTEDTIDGVEVLLQVVAKFRKSQPKDPTEVELLENAAVAMGGILNFSPASVKVFLDAQGIELVLRCLKERVYSGFVALKWLDFSGSDAVYQTACERAVDAGLLKYVFALFQGKSYPKHHNDKANRKDRKAMNQIIQNTSIRILYALMCHLKPHDEQERLERLVAKFSGDKIARMVDLLLEFDQKVRVAEYNFFKSDLEEDLDEDVLQFAALEAKLEAGGDVMHRLSALATFCCAESKTFHSNIIELLQAKGSGVSIIRETLVEFLSVLDGSAFNKEQLKALVKVF